MITLRFSVKNKRNIHVQLIDSTYNRPMKTRESIFRKLKRQYGLSITKETAHPAMQRLTDIFSSKPRRRGRSFSRFLAERNRKKNARFPKLQTYAGKQGGGGYCDRLRFGLFRMRFNGCEVISVYNVMRYLGYKPDIRDISYDFETSGSLLFGGFGVRPDSIADYLEEKTGARIKSLGPALFKDYDYYFSEAEAAIFTFWNGPKKWTIHTVMLRRLPDERVRALNFYNNRLFSDFDSISSLCSKTGKGLVPISLILIYDPETMPNSLST